MAVRNYDDFDDPLNPRHKTQPVPVPEGDLAAALQEPLAELNTPAGPTPNLGGPSPYQAKGPSLGFGGFDQSKVDRGHVSPKYVFRKHAEGLGVGDTDELLRRLQGDESGYFKNARIDRGDLFIDGELHPEFGGINAFDVVKGFSRGGEEWQWLPTGPHAEASGPQGGGGNALSGLAGLPGGSDIMQALLADGGMGGSDLMQQIQAELQRLLTGQGASSPGL